MARFSVVLGLVFILAVPENALAHDPLPHTGDDIGTLPIDHISRFVAARGRLECPDVGLVTYRGTYLKYSKPLRINPDFAKRLAEFERVVIAVAKKHYGRAPTRIVHLGSYNCRRIRAYPNYLSEHGLGNALDVSGFDFGRGDRTVERKLRRRHRVRMLKHWNAKRGVGRTHRAFLRELGETLSRRTDIFRSIYGPAWPGHKNHFHFDLAPFRVIEI